jgi:hypothetical protein
MPYFRDDDARAIIREAYGQVRSTGAAVAEAFYPPEALARLPRSAVELALGVGDPVRHARLAGQVQGACKVSSASSSRSSRARRRTS